MRALGLPVVEFEGSMKGRSSLVTKLIAKKDSVAAQIFDRVRYRVVTERADQIAPIVHHLFQHLIPFNYTVPDQTQNSLVRFGDLLRDHPRGAELARQLQLPADLEQRDPPAGKNEFSGKGFRTLTFVVDVPLRVDASLFIDAQNPSRIEAASRPYAPLSLEARPSARSAAKRR